MAAKDFLAKIILGSDIYKDLAIAEKEMYDAQGKYNNACRANSALEEKKRLLSNSLDILKQEEYSLECEKESIDTLFSKLLNDEELDSPKTSLVDKLNNKDALLESWERKICCSEEEKKNILRQKEKLQGKKISLEKDVNLLSEEIAKLEEASNGGDEKIAERRKIINQRKEIKENLLTLKEKWQETLDDMKTRVDSADNLKSLKRLELELKDYEKTVNNAIEISVK